MTHPAIADAAAVAVPSVEWGEAVGIAVVTRPGHAAPSEDELKTLIRNRLRSSRCPERVAMLDALPYNELGKLLRREVKKLFIARSEEQPSELQSLMRISYAVFSLQTKTT